jgi:putative oxidoreductase
MHEPVSINLAPLRSKMHGFRMPIARLLQPRVEAAYTLLRIVSGLLFAFHGVQKIFGVLTEHRPPLGSQLWFGGLSELVGGLAIAAGFLTPWAAFLASGTMAVAYVQFHWKLDFGARFFPAVNKGEAALLYAVLFLYIACRGGGRGSLDRAR